MTIEEYAQTLAMVLKANSVRAGEILLTNNYQEASIPILEKLGGRWFVIHIEPCRDSDPPFNPAFLELADDPAGPHWQPMDGIGRGAMVLAFEGAYGLAHIIDEFRRGRTLAQIFQNELGSAGQGAQDRE